MKKTFCITVISLCLFSVCAQNSDTLLKNIDTIYNREKVLERINERLYKLNRYYSNTCKWRNSSSFNFLYFIYDLTDTSNVFRGKDIQNAVFLDKHIYHIAANPTYCKVSMIIIPFEEKLYFFEGLNCSKKIHKIEDVLYWIENNYTEKLGESELERIINYQKYHKSVATDPMGSCPKCENKKPKKDRKKIKAPIIKTL